MSEDQPLFYIETSEKGLILNFPFTLQAKDYLFPFEFDDPILKQFSPELATELESEHEDRLNFSLHALFYALTLSSKYKMFRVGIGDNNTIRASPGSEWGTEFRTWYEKQKGVPVIGMPDKSQENHYHILLVNEFHCYVESHQLNIKLSNGVNKSYFFKVKNISHVHWCVAITQAYRKKEPLAFKIEEEMDEILDIKNIK